MRTVQEWDWKHWLFGINWGDEMAGSRESWIGFHVGPYFLMVLWPARD